eukprot:1984585-Rhodomonas_salina.1
MQGTRDSALFARTQPVASLRVRLPLSLYPAGSESETPSPSASDRDSGSGSSAPQPEHAAVTAEQRCTECSLTPV